MAGKEPWQHPEVGMITNQMEREAKQHNIPMQEFTKGFSKIVQLPTCSKISKLTVWDKFPMDFKDKIKESSFERDEGGEKSKTPMHEDNTLGHLGRVH